MNCLSLRTYGDRILRQKCRQVKGVDKKTRSDLEEMAGVMYGSGGIGLAGPQVGIDAQLVVADAGQGLWHLANPRVVSREGTITGQEGCLSLPGVSVSVTRSRHITVEALDGENRKIIIEADDLLSQVLQHEIDHLRGKLIIDYLPPAKKKEAEKRLKLWLQKTPRM